MRESGPIYALRHSSNSETNTRLAVKPAMWVVLVCEDKCVTATIQDFISEARQYCALIEGSQAQKNSWTFANECLRSVLPLYSAALALPETDPGNNHALDIGIGHADWQAMRTSVAEKLSRDVYWEIFEPLEAQLPEAVVGSIPDDLVDIWRDVKPASLVKVNAGAAVWDWRFSMETHWARHAVGVASALTALCFGPQADRARPITARPGKAD